MKMFVSFKNSRTFATSYNIARSGKTASNDSGFFISVCECIGYNTPSLMLNGTTAPCECRTEGKVMPFFYSITNKRFHSVMSYTEKNVNAMNNSNCIDTPCSATSAQSSLLELLPKVAHIGMEVENKIFNLSNTKDLLLDNLNSGLDELPDGVLKDRLYNILWQIQTIDDCIADCMTSDDFYNLDKFIFYSKELLTPKNK